MSIFTTDGQTDGRTDSHSDCSANLRVVQYCYTRTVEITCKYRLEQSVSVRALPEVIVGDAWAAVAFFFFFFFYKSLPCGPRVMSIFTNYPQAAVLMLGVASSPFCLPVTRQC